MLLPPTHPPPHREFVWGVLCSGRLRGRRWLSSFLPVWRQGPGDVQGWIRCVQFSFNTLRLRGKQKELVVTTRDLGFGSWCASNKFLFSAKARFSFREGLPPPKYLYTKFWKPMDFAKFLGCREVSDHMTTTRWNYTALEIAGFEIAQF